MTVTHVCPDCGLTLTQRIRGGSIDNGCPDCSPEKWSVDTEADRHE